MDELFTVLSITLLSGCVSYPEKNLFACLVSSNFIKVVSKSAIISNMRITCQVMSVSDSKVLNLFYFQSDDDYISAIHYSNIILFVEAKNALKPQLKKYRRKTKDKKKLIISINNIVCG
ncbi:hypothetical protein ABCJ02_003104 [Salmonella enterica]|uniref:hypothetical protein n=1 Tax=Salmonella enterica TaxID=28901 RepID=UPI0031C9FE1E